MPFPMVESKILDVFFCLFVSHDVDYGLLPSILLSKYMYFSSKIKGYDDVIERERLLVKENTYNMLSYTQSPDLTVQSRLFTAQQSSKRKDSLSRLVLGSEPRLSLRMKASEHRIKRW
ncbi:hypothetical protein AMTRI_Chr09g36700 [Amborella trichopoda]